MKAASVHLRPDTPAAEVKVAHCCSIDEAGVACQRILRVSAGETAAAEMPADIAAAAVLRSPASVVIPTRALKTKVVDFLQVFAMIYL